MLSDAATPTNPLANPPAITTTTTAPIPASPAPAPVPVPMTVTDPVLASLIQDWRALWTPPERLPLSVWAERNIVLSSEYAARASELRLFGWQREILDSFTDPATSEIVMYCGSQLVKTLFVQCAIAYVICEDPGPILLVEPKDQDAKDFSKERLAPMLRDCACLHDRVSENHQDGTNTMLAKNFPGGNISLVGSISPGNLARRSIRYLFCDEVDKYPASAGHEGDPMDIAQERMATFGSRKKSIKCCTPTVAGKSRIGKAYRASDQRKPYVPCPFCRAYQILRWSQVKWDSGRDKDHQPATAKYECENQLCGARWNDGQRWSACNQAEWRASAPFAGIAGFWISHLYSPWKKLSEIVAHFLRAKDDRQQFQVFVNTVLAEEWQELGETPDHEILYGRREQYPYGAGPDAVIPQRGLFLTSAVDVQDNPPRLEVETVAWGRERENWSVDYRVIQVFAENGEPLPVTSRELWDQLDADVLQRNWLHESGQTLPILVMAIDTGNRPKPVYEFARRHPQLAYGPSGLRLHAIRTVVPVKGTPDPLRIIASVSKEDAAKKRQGVRIVGVGTHCAKQEIYDLLRHTRPKLDGTLSGVAAPGCYHFPHYDMVYFEGLTAEVRLVKENGDVVYEKRRPRNEPLDCKVYGRAAAAIVGIDRFTEAQWRQLEQAVTKLVMVGTTQPMPPPPPLPPAPPVQQPDADLRIPNALVPIPYTPRGPNAVTRTVRRGFL